MKKRVPLRRQHIPEAKPDGAYENVAAMVAIGVNSKDESNGESASEPKTKPRRLSCILHPYYLHRSDAAFSCGWK